MAAPPPSPAAPAGPAAHVHDECPLGLRPGFAAVRRDPAHLQVGLAPEPAVVLDDHPDVRRLLGLLDGAHAVPRSALPASLPARRALTALIEGGLVVPRGEAEPPVARSAWATHGPDAPRRAAARATTSVGVEAEPGLRQRLTALLRDAGLTTAGGGTGEAPTVTVWVRHGPLDRGLLDPYVREGHPHLLVTGGPTTWEVGPFVVPGRTACVRCTDAHLAEQDPRRGVVLGQLAAQVPGRTSTQLRPPSDPLQQALALAWAVRDVAAWVDGVPPSTWSTTWTLGPTGGPTARSWRRHPHCGCAWDVVLGDPTP